MVEDVGREGGGEGLFEGLGFIKGWRGVDVFSLE